MAEMRNGKKPKRGHSPSQIDNIVTQPRRRHWQYKIPGGWMDYDQSYSDFLNSETGEDGRPINPVPVAMDIYVSGITTTCVDFRNFIEWSYYDNEGRWVGRPIRIITE